MVYASEYLIKRGVPAKCLNYINCNDVNKYYDALRTFNNIVLPLPESKDNINIYGTVSENGNIKIKDFYSNLSAKTKVFSNKVPDNNVFECENICNYSQNENFLFENAYITAEGAVGHILEHSGLSLKDSKVLIIGWGRIAKCLYRTISAFTSNIFLVLRNKETVTSLRDSGIFASTFADLPNICADCDVIINTVPARVIENDIIDKLKKNSCLYELASTPGGYDHEYATGVGINSYVLRGLPGKCAPASAGKALGKCIHEYISAGGETL